LRPKPVSGATIGLAFRQGGAAAWENIGAIVGLQALMAAIVAVYYCWPPGSAVLARYAAWQTSGGDLGNGLAAGLAGGVLSELSLVYFQDRGRWRRSHVESLCFKFAIFFVAGCIVYQFYRLQAYWWGQGASLGVLVPKVLVDQFGYTVLFAAPYYAVMTRWFALRYSVARLLRELDARFVTERMLPVLVMNWMFWIPAITLVYAMPFALQPPLYIFATAIWGLLVAAIGRQTARAAANATTISPPGADLVVEPAE
jgi:hypothetical protein